MFAGYHHAIVSDVILRVAEIEPGKVTCIELTPCLLMRWHPIGFVCELLL